MTSLDKYVSRGVQTGHVSSLILHVPYTDQDPESNGRSPILFYRSENRALEVNRTIPVIEREYAFAQAPESDSQVGTSTVRKKRHSRGSRVTAAAGSISTQFDIRGYGQQQPVACKFWGSFAN